MGHKYIDLIPKQEDGGKYNRAVILSGPSGIGKTSAAVDLADGAPLTLIPMGSRTADNFGVYNVPDKQVIENPDGSKGYMWKIVQPLIESALEPFLEHNIGDGYGVVVFDDVTLSEERTQAGLLDIVQFHTIGGHKIGKNVQFVLTGNGIEDGCYAVPWSKALMGRSMMRNYRPNFEKWLELPCNKNLSPVVIGFLKNHNEFFAPSSNNREASDENGKTPCPRDWTSLGAELVNIHGNGKAYKPLPFVETLNDWFGTMVGEKTGSMLNTFFNTMEKYPSGEEVFHNPQERWSNLPIEDRNNIGAQYSVAHGVRNYFIRQLNALNADAKIKPKQREEQKQELVDKLANAMAHLMKGGSREIGNFITRYVLSNMDRNDNAAGYFFEICHNVNGNSVLHEAGIQQVMADMKQIGMMLER